MCRFGKAGLFSSTQFKVQQLFWQAQRVLAGRTRLFLSGKAFLKKKKEEAYVAWLALLWLLPGCTRGSVRARHCSHPPLPAGSRWWDRQTWSWFIRPGLLGISEYPNLRGPGRGAERGAQGHSWRSHRNLPENHSVPPGEDSLAGSRKPERQCIQPGL